MVCTYIILCTHLFIYTLIFFPHVLSLAQTRYSPLFSFHLSPCHWGAEEEEEAAEDAGEGKIDLSEGLKNQTLNADEKIKERTKMNIQRNEIACYVLILLKQRWPSLAEIVGMWGSSCEIQQNFNFFMRFRWLHLNHPLIGWSHCQWVH